jgi:cell division protein FtsW (lipid II flippase)
MSESPVGADGEGHPEETPDEEREELLGDWDPADRERVRWGISLATLVVVPLVELRPPTGPTLVLYGASVFLCVFNLGFPRTLMGAPAWIRTPVFLVPLLALAVLVTEVPATAVGLLAFVALGLLARNIAARE